MIYHVDAPLIPTSPPPDASNGPFCVGCGFSLRGLAMDGKCPECGAAYTEATQYWVQPWPPLSLILLRLSWPLLLLLPVLLAVIDNGSSNPLIGFAMLCGAIAVPVFILNGYILARRLVNECISPWKRSSRRGRSIYITCSILFITTLLLVLLPAAMVGWVGISCMVDSSGRFSFF